LVDAKRLRPPVASTGHAAQRSPAQRRKSHSLRYRTEGIRRTIAIAEDAERAAEDAEFEAQMRRFRAAG